MRIISIVLFFYRNRLCFVFNPLPLILSFAFYDTKNSFREEYSKIVRVWLSAVSPYCGASPQSGVNPKSVVSPQSGASLKSEVIHQRDASPKSGVSPVREANPKSAASPRRGLLLRSAVSSKWSAS